ncbi:MAG: hypothetical protein N3D78_02260 [Candidatus Aenigmarchaeota archaeon]|nr:hypothetical protein [Candidatus Aenigmarchaeota archaeon]
MFPEDVLTKSKKGRAEVRNLIARGEFVWYDYRDPESFEKVESGKSRLFLKDEDGTVYSFFVIPMRESGRYLLIKAEADEEKKIWNEKKKKVESLWL